jgi:hypothetical protein
MVTLRGLLSTCVIGAVLLVGAAAGGGAGTVRTRKGLETNPRTGIAAQPFAELVRAVKQHDRGATERLVARMGPGRLAQGLAQTDRRVVLAVLEAAPEARGAVLLVDPVADLTSSGDPPVAEAAARALGQLLDGDLPMELEQWDVPPDAVAHGCAALRGLALRGLAPATARLAALSALGDATSTCGDTDALLSLLQETDPALRRAAAHTVRARTPIAQAALLTASRDPDVGVASAAAAALCRGRPISATAVEAARGLILHARTTPDDAVEMLLCLVAAGTPADAKLLEQIRGGPPSPLRDQALLLAPPPLPATAPGAPPPKTP